MENASATGEWLHGSGPESDIVISSRVRLARNIKGLPFANKASQAHKQEALQRVKDALAELYLDRNFIFYDLSEVDDLDQQLLVERHLISRDLASSTGPKGAAIGDKEILSVMVNEEDHLRMQAMRSGFQAKTLWEEIDGFDSHLNKHIEYAFDSRFGYLTACPTNVGTGIRVSVMVHLPGLVMTGQIEKVWYAVSKINLAVRGLYGEGSQASGDFYQISNQITLGKSEEGIVETLMSVIPQVVLYERQSREQLLHDDRYALEDKVFRSLGLLQSARLLNSEETLDALSFLRLGINQSLIDNIDIRTVNELFILTRPAHLQKLKQQQFNDKELDMERASLVRRHLNQGS